jgi:hypothetical protein
VANGVGAGYDASCLDLSDAIRLLAISLIRSLRIAETAHPPSCKEWRALVCQILSCDGAVFASCVRAVGDPETTISND